MSEYSMTGPEISIKFSFNGKTKLTGEIKKKERNGWLQPPNAVTHKRRLRLN